MKAFAEYYRTNTFRFENGKFVDCAPYNVPACGSDSILHLDARYSRLNMAIEAKKHMDKLNTNLNKGYTGFKIHYGSIGCSVVRFCSFEADRIKNSSKFINA